MQPKILLTTILRAQGANGVITSTNSLVNTFKEAGYEAELVTPFDISPLIYTPIFAVRPLINPITPKTGVWWHRHFHAALLRRVLAKKLEVGRPTVICAQCPVSAKVALDIRDPTQHTVALFVHFNLSQAEEWRDQGFIRENDWVWRSCVRLEQEVLPAVDRLLYASEFMRHHLENRHPKLASVPAMVGVNFIDAPAEGHHDRTQTKRDLVSVGSLEPRKNQVFLLRVLQEAKTLGHRYTLTIVGNGPDMHHLKVEADRLGVATQVDFVGERPDVTEYLASHRLLVHAAKMEAFGIALIEAMAYALPVIAAPVGGIPEIFSGRSTILNVRREF
jgi:glycosyltransferase involved in cell wall biosynthesis